MTPIERVQAAIDKLTAVRDASTPPTDGPAWIQGRADHRWERTSEVYTGDEDTDESADVVLNSAPADAELIVTLHATIDPLLSTLERWLEYRPLAMEEPIVALADSILGAQS